MRRNTALVVRVLIMGVVLYTLMLGGTFNGVVNLTLTRASLLLLTVGIGLWLWLRWRVDWPWRRTPFDRWLLLFAGGVALSVLVNFAVWRRMSIGLWYWGVFLGVWLLLHDLVSNGVPRRWLLDGVLLTGGAVLFFGYWQLQPWLASWLAVSAAGIPAPFIPPRPGSIIGNPNALGAFLSVLALLIVGRVWTADRLHTRVGWGSYLVLALGLLFFTLSRGAWAGFAVGLAAFVFFAAQRGSLGRYLTWRYWRAWWARQRNGSRLLTVMALVIVAAAALLLLVVAYRAVDQPGRSIDTRLVIWNAALQTFLQHPVVGTGPFTFGRELLGYHSTPPMTAHTHAHNLPLHVAAEMGVIGLVLLAWAGWIVWRGWWQHMKSGEFAYLLAPGAALIGMAAHQLLDMPTTMPALMLLGILLLVVVVASSPDDAPFASRWRWLGIGGLWVLLLFFGWWGFITKTVYVDALLTASGGAWREGGEQLADVIALDPAMPLYPAQQGFVFGIATAEGDETAAVDAITAWQQALAMEPGYAPWWANLAALYFQVGEVDAARDAFETGVQLAPESAVLWLNFGIAQEQFGDEAAARTAYQEALDLYPLWGYAPFWQESSLRRDVVRLPDAALDFMPPVFNLALAALLDGDPGRVLDLLADDPALYGESAPVRVLYALALHQTGQPETARLWLESAYLCPQRPHDTEWLAVAEALVAAWQGQDSAPGLVARVQQTFYGGARGFSFPTGQNFAWFHFLRDAFPTQFLPQLTTLPDDPRAAVLFTAYVE